MRAHIAILSSDFIDNLQQPHS